MNKALLILAAAVILGGCTLGAGMNKQSSTDSDSVMSPEPTPQASQMPDTELETMPDTKTSTDQESIEADLKTTVILEEDFSDLE